MARARGVYRRGDSPYWWIDVILPNGVRVRQSAKTEDRQQAVALLAKFKVDAFKQSAFGVKQRRSWQEAVVRYLALKSNLRSIEDVRRICRKLDPVLGKLMLDRIDGDVVCKVIEHEQAKGNKPATINRYLALMRCLLRTARDEWQWIEVIPKIRLLRGEVERDRWLTRVASRIAASRFATSLPTTRGRPRAGRQSSPTCAFTICATPGPHGIGRPARAATS
jgi:hypothetical protein